MGVWRAMNGGLPGSWLSAHSISPSSAKSQSDVKAPSLERPNDDRRHQILLLLIAIIGEHRSERDTVSLPQTAAETEIKCHGPTSKIWTEILMTASETQF